MVLGDNKVVLQQSSASVKDTDDESTYTGANNPSPLPLLLLTDS